MTLLNKYIPMLGLKLGEDKILYSNGNTYKFETEENWLECIDYLRIRWTKDKSNAKE